MRSNFWHLLALQYCNIEAERYIMPVVEDPGFPIHPSASELAEQMLVDPDVLKNETYEPGLYDETGDYFPQYSDDPSSLPEGFDSAPLSRGDTAPESLPASDPSNPSSPNGDGDFSKTD